MTTFFSASCNPEIMTVYLAEHMFAASERVAALVLQALLAHINTLRPKAGCHLVIRCLLDFKMPRQLGHMTARNTAVPCRSGIRSSETLYAILQAGRQLLLACHRTLLGYHYRACAHTKAVSVN